MVQTTNDLSVGKPIVVRGKSKLIDKMLVFETFFYAIEHPEELRLHILYFTLEMSKEEKMYDLYCYLLWRLDHILIDKTRLKSTEKGYMCPDEILDLIESERYQSYINKFNDCVEFVDNVRHPTGIFKYCERFAEEHGHWTFKDGKVRNGDDFVDGKVKDSFIWDDEELYPIIAIDNYANLDEEAGLDKRRTIERMSKYNIQLRDKYAYSINAVQHLNLASEDTSGRNFGHEIDLTPNPSNLGDAKNTVRDVNMMLSLFNPYKYGIRQYPDGEVGYDVTKFKNYLRFMKIVENRDGDSGKQVALFFIGAIGEFYELPPATDELALQKWYELVKVLDQMKINHIVGNPKDYLNSVSNKESFALTINSMSKIDKFRRRFFARKI